MCSDANTLKYKGGPTVILEADCYASVRHCRYVDKVYRNPPFFCTFEFLDEIKVWQQIIQQNLSIQADLVAHDSLPYSAIENDDAYDKFKHTDRFIETQRTLGVSTTNVIARIVANVEEYREWNKLRGY